MATEVTTTEDILLSDGLAITLRPLNIKNQRKFMKGWTDFVNDLRDNSLLDDDDKKKKDENEMNDHQFDVYTYLASLCLEKALKETGKEFEKNDELVEYLEETLDEPTLLHVLDKCGGLKLNDPNLQAAALAATTGQDGMS